MYNWLFFKIFLFYKSKNNDNPIFNTSALVCFTQIVHGMVLLILLSKFFSFDIPSFRQSYFFNKLYIMPFVLIWLIIIFFFYKKKLKKIEFKDDVEPMKSYYFALLIFIIVFIPLYIGIKMSGGEIWQ
mgnify:CR=1 FL=1